MTDLSRTEPLQHWSSPDPFDPHSIEKLAAGQERYYMASQWQMMWWKFRRHKLALWSGVILLALYALTLVVEVVAPYAPSTRSARHIFAPPQSVHLFHEGEFVGPCVYG